MRRDEITVLEGIIRDLPSLQLYLANYERGMLNGAISYDTKVTGGSHVPDQQRIVEDRVYMELRSAADSIQSSLDDLDDTSRRCVVMRYIHRARRDEIAERMSVDQKTIYRRTIAALRLIGPRILRYLPAIMTWREEQAMRIK